jgi:DNA-binding beta-propeller fold protein YncE
MIGELAIAGTPYCLAVDDRDVMYVGMKDHVEVYGADGKSLKSWGSFGEKAYLTSITAAGEDVWVGDAGRRVAVRCDREGKVIGEIGKADPSKELKGLVMPSPHLDVAVGPDGLVWVNNPGMHRLEGYAKDGQLERFWGVAGNKIEAFPGCCNPADFAVLKDGSFITAEKVTPRVKRYLNDGTFEGVVAPPDAFGQNMTGIDVAVDGEGRVLMMERGKREVRIFVRDEGGGK